MKPCDQFAANRLMFPLKEFGRPSTFVTGGLDPADERAELLVMLEQQSAPVMVIVADHAPPSSKAEMEAMTKSPEVQVAHLPGSLGMAEELGDAIAPTILPFLQEGIAPAGSQLSS